MPRYVLALVILAWAALLSALGLWKYAIYRADVDPEMLPALVSGAYERMIREIIKQPRRPDIEAWARQAQAFITRGILTPQTLAVVDRKVRDGGKPNERRARKR